jgi:digeranylgeranylglycerophospholipid reductase
LRENVTTETDIAVVGGGPSGSFSALFAANSGAKVTVFEEHPTIGSPTHCAGHVSLSGLKQLGLKLPSPILENTFRSAAFFSPSGKRFFVRFPSPVTCAIDRELLDQHLANIASNKGARFLLRSRVKLVVQQQDGARGLVANVQGETEKIMPNLIIDAEGISSTILKNQGLKPFNDKIVVKAVSAELDQIRDIENDSVEVYFGSEFADGFYAWIIPKRDGTAKVGLGTRRGNPRQCLERFKNNHSIAGNKMRKGRITRIVYHSIPLGGPISKTYANGFLVVGDAASQVKPTTGGGIVIGLTCAKIAGEVAASAVKEGTFSDKFLKCYEDKWKQRVKFDMRMLLSARKLLNRLSDREMDKVFDVANKLRLDESLIQMKNVDFSKKELMRLAKSPPALATLASFLFSAFT